MNTQVLLDRTRQILLLETIDEVAFLFKANTETRIFRHRLESVLRILKEQIENFYSTYKKHQTCIKSINPVLSKASIPYPVLPEKYIEKIQVLSGKLQKISQNLQNATKIPSPNPPKSTKSDFITACSNYKQGQESQLIFFSTLETSLSNLLKNREIPSNLIFFRSDAEFRSLLY